MRLGPPAAEEVGVREGVRREEEAPDAAGVVNVEVGRRAACGGEGWVV